MIVGKISDTLFSEKGDSLMNKTQCVFCYELYTKIPDGFVAFSWARLGLFPVLATWPVLEQGQSKLTRQGQRREEARD